MRYILLFMCSGFLLSGLSEADTILVPSEYTTIQAGIDAAVDGDTVLVADGVYTGYGNKLIEFAGKAVCLISENGPDNCIIDLQNDGRGFNLADGETASTVIEGFSIINGFYEKNVGFFLGGSSPTIRNCVVENCTAYGDDALGAGVGMSSSDAIFENCIFRRDSVINTGSWGMGGAVSFSEASPEFYNCLFIENYVEGTWARGGGVYCSESSPLFSDCMVAGNSVDGFSYSKGAGMHFYESEPVIIDCHIDSNFIYSDQYHRSGGGIYSDESAITMIRTVLSNNRIYGVNGDGGGLLLTDSDGSIIQNCTFIANELNGSSSSSEGSAISIEFCNPEIINSIFAYNPNRPALCFIVGSQSFLHHNSFYGNGINNENFQGTVPGRLGEIVTTNANGDSCDIFYNIYLPPRFVDWSGGNYYLQSVSSCIDAGDPESPLDPDSTVSDIGAYYFDQNVFFEEPAYEPLPQSSVLISSYPNPFNSETTISYIIPRADRIDLSAYNIQGGKVATLYDGFKPSGSYEIVWKADNYPSGVYFVELSAGNHYSTQKLLLLK